MIIKDVIDFFESIVVIFAGVTAMWAIFKWRVEHLGKRRIELSEDALALFLQGSGVINNARRSMTFENSNTEAFKRRDNETDREYRVRSEIGIVVERLNSNMDIFNDIHAMRFRFHAVFGKDKTELFTEFRQVIDELIYAAHRLYEHRILDDSSFSEERLKKHNDDIDKYDRVIFSSGDSDDITNRLDVIVKKIELICRKEQGVK